MAFSAIQGLFDPAALSEFVEMAVTQAEVTGEPSQSLKRPGAGVVVAAGAASSPASAADPGPAPARRGAAAVGRARQTRPSNLVEAVEWSSI